MGCTEDGEYSVVVLDRYIYRIEHAVLISKHISVSAWKRLNKVIVAMVMSTNTVPTVLYDVMHLRSEIFAHMLLGSADECITHVRAIVCRRMCSETG
jgi:hypothetical protein